MKEKTGDLILIPFRKKDGDKRPKKQAKKTQGIEEPDLQNFVWDKTAFREHLHELEKDEAILRKNQFSINDATKSSFIDDPIGIWYLLQTSIEKLFGACNGLLIFHQERFYIIDANLEPRYSAMLIKKLSEYWDSPLRYVFVSHSHLDHACNLHYYEEKTDCQFICPHIEDLMISSYDDHLRLTGFKANGVVDRWFEYARDTLDFIPVSSERIFSCKPNEKLNFEGLEIQLIPFKSHSHGHVGFRITKPILQGDFRVLYLSCLGIDYDRQGRGFGPWYGFYYTFIEDCIENCIRADRLWTPGIDLMCASHSRLFREYSPFACSFVLYKLSKNHMKVEQRIKEFVQEKERNRFSVGELIAYKDTIYKLNKIKEPYLSLFKHWQYEFTRHHLIYLVNQGLATRDYRDIFTINIT